MNAFSKIWKRFVAPPRVWGKRKSSQIREQLTTCSRACVGETLRLKSPAGGTSCSRARYVLSANVHRRHLTKGQQAMATALAYPDKEKGGRGKKSGLNPEFLGTDPSYVNRARFVLSNCRDKAIEVLRNAKYPLTIAYDGVSRPYWDRQPIR